MVQSKAATVDAYIAEASPERAPHLRKIAELCRRTLPDHAEVMAYGMPAYLREGQAGFAFANQKQYVALYVDTAVSAKHAEALRGLDMGKVCLRYRNPAKIDYALLERLLLDTRDSPPGDC
jgi:uncharacterized protein YdhG (YjbR/CyaY superfamily)